jgi:hypothetical protein
MGQDSLKLSKIVFADRLPGMMMGMSWDSSVMHRGRVNSETGLSASEQTLIKRSFKIANF